jgi:hypothetical protein
MRDPSPVKQLINGALKVIRVPAGDHRFSYPINRKGISKISIITVVAGFITLKNTRIEKPWDSASPINMVYWFEPQDDHYPGYLCVFTDRFFDQFLDHQLSAFKPGASLFMPLRISTADLM